MRNLPSGGPHTIVVGAGWSGLAAAVELARHRLPVTVLEASRQVGGRARAVQIRGWNVDNGQHLLIGAYREILRLTALLGIDEAEIFARRPLRLVTRALDESAVRLRLPRLPAPWHLLGGLLGATGLDWSERRRALRLCAALLAAPPGAVDLPVRDFLIRHGQSTRLIAALWEPLCLAMLNTPIDCASGAVFAAVLRAAFARRRADSDLLLPRTDLGRVFPEPARAFVERRGGAILFNHRAAELRLHGGAVQGVTCTNGAALDAGQVILALPPPACARLLEPHAALRGVGAALAAIGSAPICTVYLQFPPEVRLEFPMVGLHGALTQWVFDRAGTGCPGLMAAVISGPGAHMNLGNEALRARVTGELARFFPDWPAPSDGLVIREKRATFLCRAGIADLRPRCATPVEGCWLAGDAAASPFPATLEGAVRNGVACARAIVARHRRTEPVTQDAEP